MLAAAEFDAGARMYKKSQGATRLVFFRPTTQLPTAQSIKFSMEWLGTIGTIGRLHATKSAEEVL